MYSAVRDFGIVKPGWEISRADTVVARMSWTPALTLSWHVSSDDSSYQLKRRMLSFAQTYEVDGGDFSGALFEGSLLDRKFVLTWRDVVFARATAALMSMTDHHHIEVYSHQEDIQLLVAVCMVSLHSEHMNEPTRD